MDPDDHLARFYPPDPTLTAPKEPKMRKIKPRPLHPMQWVTYVIVSATCIFIMYLLITGLMLLDDLSEWLKSMSTIGVL